MQDIGFQLRPDEGHLSTGCLLETDLLRPKRTPAYRTTSACALNYSFADSNQFTRSAYVSFKHRQGPSTLQTKIHTRLPEETEQGFSIGGGVGVW